MIPDHERMDVYQRALELVSSVHALRPTLDRRSADQFDQLDRAARSVVHNIAEGAGEYRPREKARFYRIARRSATEVSAALDILAILGNGEQSVIASASSLAHHINGSLVGLARCHEHRAKSKASEL